MRTILLLVMIFSSQVSLAKSTENIRLKFPTVLSCNAEIPGLKNNELVIKNLQTDEPEGNLYDASLLDYSVDSFFTRIDFSNECDNNYTVAFKADSFAKLVSGKVSEVSGIIHYESGGDGKAKATMKCRRTDVEYK